MNIENYRLKKVTFRKDGGLEIDYEQQVTASGHQVWNKISRKSVIPRHKDLQVMIEKFRVHLCRVHGILALKHLQADEWTTLEKETFEEIVNSVTMVSIASGGDDEISLVLAGKRTRGNGVLALTTYKLSLEDNMDYAQSDELAELYSEFRVEVYQYFEDNKTSELTLFDELKDDEFPEDAMEDEEEEESIAQAAESVEEEDEVEEVPAMQAVNE